MNLEKLKVVELEAQEVKSVEGGFIPLVILGITYSASTVAAWCGVAFVAGTAAGIAVYSK